MATLDDQIHALIAKLTEDTERGALRWEKSVAVGPSPQRFEVRLATQDRARIESHGEDGGYPYWLTIVNSTGHEVETIKSLGPQDRVGKWDTALRALYSAARASALDISGTVGRMLSSLGADPNKVEPMPAPEHDDIPF